MSKLPSTRIKTTPAPAGRESPKNAFTSQTSITTTPTSTNPKTTNKDTNTTTTTPPDSSTNTSKNFRKRRLSITESMNLFTNLEKQSRMNTIQQQQQEEEILKKIESDHSISSTKKLLKKQRNSLLSRHNQLLLMKGRTSSRDDENDESKSISLGTTKVEPIIIDDAMMGTECRTNTKNNNQKNTDSSTMTERRQSITESIKLCTDTNLEMKDNIQTEEQQEERDTNSFKLLTSIESLEKFDPQYSDNKSDYGTEYTEECPYIFLDYTTLCDMSSVTDHGYESPSSSNSIASEETSFRNSDDSVICRQHTVYTSIKSTFDTNESMVPKDNNYKLISMNDDAKKKKKKKSTSVVVETLKQAVERILFDERHNVKQYIDIMNSQTGNRFEKTVPFLAKEIMEDIKKNKS